MKPGIVVQARRQHERVVEAAFGESVPIEVELIADPTVDLGGVVLLGHGLAPRSRDGVYRGGGCGGRVTGVTVGSASGHARTGHPTDA